jgi:hypothetical protein
VPPFVAGLIFPIWRPFFGLEVRIHEMGCVEVGARYVSYGMPNNTVQHLLAEYRGLKRLDLHTMPKAWFQFIH